jgi:magnesium transporter
MLKAYTCGGNRLNQIDFHAQSHNHDLVIWFDLISPTDEETALVAMVSGLELPGETEIVEIENSSRLNVNDDVLTMTMPIVTRTPYGLQGSSCGFVLSPKRLVTIRYAESLVFDKFPGQPHETSKLHEADSAYIFVGLLEAIVDRQADALEQLRTELDIFSHKVFREDGPLVKQKGRRERDEEEKLRQMLTTLGVAYDNISFLRDSQLGVARIAPYVSTAATAWLPKPVDKRLKTLQADISSLNEFSTHLTDKVQFLLDATLGLINIVQSTLMKVFTVVAVIGIPPTLMAGIYGMNFHDMPELSWTYGYPYGLAVILLTAILPLVWFRMKGWL